MRRWLGYLLGLVLLLGLGYFGVDYKTRRMQFPIESTQSQYGGGTQMMQSFAKQLWVEPIQGAPFLAPDGATSQYPPDQYRVIAVPSQNALVYGVGRVMSWDDIEGSGDKYLVLTHDNGRVESYRVALTPSELFGDNPTQLMVEAVEIAMMGSGTTKLRDYGRGESTVEMGIEALRRVVRVGDVVVVRPIWEPPRLSKVDSGGNYLARNIIVRRAW